MKKILFLLLSFFLFITGCYAYGASSEIVMDADSGRVLHAKNTSDIRLLASTTKLMTALVVVNNSSLNDEVTAGEEILSTYGSSIYLKLGEVMTVKDLLYGLLLRSGNDAAATLAVYTAGSIEGFSLLMNETALNLNMKNTTFSNPSGLDEDTENKSTVYDMALLMKEILKHKELMEIMSTRKYTVRTNMNTHVWYNKNKLIDTYKYATGGKIGFTKRARHTFVSSASKNNEHLIVATFVDSDRFVTHEMLYEKYFNEYDNYKIIDKNNLNINYDSKYRVYTKEDFSMMLRHDEVDKVNRHIVLYKDIQVGEEPKVVGEVHVYMGDTEYKSMYIYARSNVQSKKKSIWDHIKGLLW